MPQANLQEWTVFFEEVGYGAASDFSVHLLARGTTCFPWVSGRRQVEVKGEDLGVRRLWV